MAKYRIRKNWQDYWHLERCQWVWDSWLPRKEWVHVDSYPSLIDASIALQIVRLNG